jgi:hypothetical protein
MIMDSLLPVGIPPAGNINCNSFGVSTPVQLQQNTDNQKQELLTNLINKVDYLRMILTAILFFC